MLSLKYEEKNKKKDNRSSYFFGQKAQLSK